MNEKDFAREFKKARKERIQRLQEDPKNNRRLQLIQQMEDNEGFLPPGLLKELHDLQKHFNLPADF